MTGERRGARRWAAGLLVAGVLAGCTGSEVSEEEPAPEDTGLLPAPDQDPTAAGAPDADPTGAGTPAGGAVGSEAAVAPPATDGAGTPPPVEAGTAPSEGAVDDGNRVPSAIPSPTATDLPLPVPVPTNPTAALPTPYQAVPEDGIPDPVALEPGVPVWGVYMAYGPTPDDPALTAVTQALDGAGEAYAVTQVGCDVGASEALGLPLDASAVVLHFQSERAAYYWLEASGAEAVGVAQVQPCGATPAG